MREAELEDSGSGLAPVTEGWFVVNVRDAEWWFSERRGARCSFESEYGDPPVEFEQLAINVTVLEPGQPSGLYHSESTQEAFLVLSGECRLLVEGEERLLRPWDFFHSPPWTEHIFVGAGDGPCAILMVGYRSGNEEVVYPADEVAKKHNAAAKETTPNPREAYADYPRSERAPLDLDGLPWSDG